MNSFIVVSIYYPNLAGQYNYDKYEYERHFMETVLWMGSEHTRPWRYSRRYGLITSADYDGEFWDRYPRMAEVDLGLDGDSDGNVYHVLTLSVIE